MPMQARPEDDRRGCGDHDIRTHLNEMPPLESTAPSGVMTHPHQLPQRLCAHADALMPAAEAFPMRINGHMLALLQHAEDPLARQLIPHPDELADHRTDLDPLCEAQQSPAPLVVHRYPGRVILLVSNQCAVHCRFCMRKRNVGQDHTPSPMQLRAALAYLRSTPRIREVILSGGDPLMLADGELNDILSALKKIPHIRMLRLHTRIPGVWPQRVTPALTKILSHFHPLFINLHFNHPAEITADSAAACTRLANAGIPLGSQTVLLKHVNDDTDTLQRLLEDLIAVRVRPYYLHQIDRVPGTAHFHVPVETGLQLMEDLRGRLSGMAIPHYMIDLPGGGGKTPLLPASIIRKSSDHWIIRDFQGRPVHYPLT